MAECADMSVSHLVSLLQVARGRSKGNFIVHNFCTDRGEARAESSRVEHEIFADVRRISSLSFSELLPPRHSEQLPGALLQSVSASVYVCVCEPCWRDQQWKIWWNRLYWFASFVLRALVRIATHNNSVFLTRDSSLFYQFDLEKC